MCALSVGLLLHQKNPRIKETRSLFDCYRSLGVEPHARSRVRPTHSRWDWEWTRPSRQAEGSAPVPLHGSFSFVVSGLLLAVD